MKTTDERYLKQLQAAVLLRQAGRPGLAMTVADDLLPERDKEPALWHTFGQIKTDMGAFTEALVYHRRAIELLRARKMSDDRIAEYQTAVLGLACALMRHGLFEEAWPYWEAGRIGPSWTPWPGSRLWAGQQAESLLVQAEGGYGDIFQFMRWLPEAKKRAGAIGLTLFPRLADFCDWSALGVGRVYKVGVDQLKFGEYEYATSILSLPGALGMKTWEDVPSVEEVRYHLQPVRIMGGQPFRIGFCWRAEENSAPIPIRSLSYDCAGAVVNALIHDAHFSNGVEILSLSIGNANLYKTDDAPGQCNVDFMKYEPGRQTSWRATAEYMCSMDFILTVDTAVAHLAGLLGIPALVLLPVNSEWRWGMPDRTSGPWYGPQLTYHRQRRPLHWDAREIAAAALARIR